MASLSNNNNNNNNNSKIGSDTLYNGNCLFAGESLISQNGVYRATMQKNGNFVILYQENGEIIFSTNTNGTNEPYKLCMVSDNNLCLYDNTGKVIWHTHTYGQGPPGTAKCILRNNGSIQVLYPTYTSPADFKEEQEEDSPDEKDKEEQQINNNNNKIGRDTLYNSSCLYEGQSLISQNKVYRATMQTNGNFGILNQKNGEIVFSTNTSLSGIPEYRLCMEYDNNLVLRSTLVGAHWHANTGSQGKHGTGIFMLNNNGSAQILIPIYTSPADNKEDKDKEDKDKEEPQTKAKISK